MAKLTKVTSIDLQRVPTGALQIDRDRPGIFIHGDEVGGYAAVIERRLQEVAAAARDLPAGAKFRRD